MTGSAASLDLELGERSYRIIIGRGLLSSAAAFEALPAGQAGVIVTNETVQELYAERLEAELVKRYAHVFTIALPDGEAHKTWPTLQTVFDRLLAARCDRQTVLFALGGGIVGDIAGFAAACYMRGIDHVQVPTTLLAQVDSSVGGKTGINHPAGKNMIGAFHQPRRVVVDIDTLATLPRREFVAGLAEVIKYGAVADDEFLGWIEANLERLLALETDALIHAVTRSCRIKARIVAADEREGGRRAILNFGHTFGHAIEAGAGYGSWLHGEAVGCGMAMAADLSVRSGCLGQAQATRLQKLIERAGLPMRAPGLGGERYVELMRGDKKAAAGEMRFVLLDGAGQARVAPARLVDVQGTIAAFT